MTAQALVLAKAGVSASGRDWMWSLFSSSWTGNGPALRYPYGSQHQAQGILVLLHSSLRCRADNIKQLKPRRIITSQSSAARLDLLDVVIPDSRFQQPFGCWAALRTAAAGEISRQTNALPYLGTGMHFSGSAGSNCFAVSHAWCVRQPQVSIDPATIT